MKKYYLPRTISGKKNWLNTFAAKLPAHAAALNISAAEVLQVKKDAAMLNFVFAAVYSIEHIKREFVAYQQLLINGEDNQDIGDFSSVTLPGMPSADTVPGGIFKRITRLVKQIKATKNYNDSIGKDLGIIGSADGFDPNAFEIALSAKIRNNAVVLLFSNFSKVDSVVIYSRQRSETEWKLTGVADTSPFIDSRPLANPNEPEVRMYMAKGRIANKEIGVPGPIITVVFAG
jgi:hypothetical protein